MRKKGTKINQTILNLQNRLKDNYMIDDISYHLSKNPFVRTILLIGSYSRGDMNNYSDIDIVVVLNKSFLRSAFYSILPAELNNNKSSLHPYSFTIFQNLEGHCSSHIF